MTPRSKRILVVEDSLLIAQEVERMVSALGCEVVGPVSTLDGAITAARDASLDGAVMDINLHGEPAYPAVDELLARGIPLLFLTGYSAGCLPSPYGRLPCLEKPFSERQFAKAFLHVFESVVVVDKR
jgi:CheY-like chemotaxis protein